MALHLHNLSTSGLNVLTLHTKPPQSTRREKKPSSKSKYVAIAKFEQEAHPKAGLSETPSSLIRKRCQYSSLEKLEDAFDTALHLM